MKTIAKSGRSRFVIKCDEFSEPGGYRMGRIVNLKERWHGPLTPLATICKMTAQEQWELVDDDPPAEFLMKWTTLLSGATRSK